MFLKAK